MTFWINRRLRLLKETENMLKQGYDYERIIMKLGEKGVSRRKALEYIKTNGTAKTRLGKN